MRRFKRKDTINTFEPNWLSPPGDTIYDLMEERGIDEKELAYLLDESIVKLRGILKGYLSIDKKLALKLENVLGFTKDFWIKRELQYLKRLRKRKIESFLMKLL